jgi:hypothetical protein
VRRQGASPFLRHPPHTSGGPPTAHEPWPWVVLETPAALADARLPELRARVGKLLVAAATAMATAYFDDPGVVCTPDRTHLHTHPQQPA